MNHEIETQWMGKMQFNALVSGHTIIMDAIERVGGEDLGPNPKPLILTALSGCTGMDVVALLRKKNLMMNDFKIKAIGELSKQPPLEYTGIHLVYDFIGDEKNSSEAIDAVNQSQENYCGVSHMLKKIMSITWEINYNGISVFSNQQSAMRA